MQVLLLKHLINYVAEDKDEEFKEFVQDFLNPNSSVSLPWLGIFPFKVWSLYTLIGSLAGFKLGKSL